MIRRDRLPPDPRAAIERPRQVALSVRGRRSTEAEIFFLRRQLAPYLPPGPRSHFSICRPGFDRGTSWPSGMAEKRHTVSDFLDSLFLAGSHSSKDVRDCPLAECLVLADRMAQLRASGVSSFPHTAVRGSEGEFNGHAELQRHLS